VIALFGVFVSELWFLFPNAVFDLSFGSILTSDTGSISSSIVMNAVDLMVTNTVS
jgi:hypothetical protein